MPIGVPLDVHSDGHGVLTSTRYLDNPLADSILDGIKQSAIKGQSFSGQFRTTVQGHRARRGELPVKTRTDVEMREYGPTVFPAYTEAHIVGTRSGRNWLTALQRVDPEDLDRLHELFGA